MSSWLTTLPELRSVITEDTERGLVALRAALRRHPLQGFELELVGRLLREIDGRSREVTSFNVLRGAVLAGYTSEPIANAIRVALLREGILAVLYEAPFGAFREEIIDPASALYRDPPAFVVVAINHRNLQPAALDLGGGANDSGVIATWTADFQRLWAALGERLRCPVFQHVIEPTGRHWIGAGRYCSGGDADGLLARLHEQLVEQAPPFVHWVDTAGLAQRLGVRSWFDSRLHFHGAFGFSARCLPQYLEVFAGAFRAAWGLAKKCLVLDLDHTLWGGVVGDDGLDGIRLGESDAEGQAYAEFCRYLRSLKDRGVVLAICSKNEESIAKEVFERHPGMPLKLSDFSVFVCNWHDKADNIAGIARTLNIDLSHLAFVDDSAAECERVSQAYPQVGVLCLSEDPSGRIDQLEDQHWFDSVRLSAEDRMRADSYQALRQAEAARGSAGSVQEYLQGLEMRADWYAAGEKDAPRLAQMEAKTNQFNLQTRRFSEADIRGFLDEPGRSVFACRLADVFAEHGLVASMVIHQDAEALHIDNWLMSCRVFSRTLEQFMLNRLVEVARGTGVTAIVTTFAPSAKNKVIERLLPDLGFECCGDPPQGPWRLSIGPGWTERTTFVRSASRESAGTAE